MRITALGTGMPNGVKKAASISYYVELGNGDKFLFDIGTGSVANLFALRPDFSKIDKVFASHLHVDHVGDFMPLHIAGTVRRDTWGGRDKLEVTIEDAADPRLQIRSDAKP